MDGQLLDNNCITVTLPNLSTDQVEAVMAKLTEIGVETLNDLIEVTEQDLVSVLKPIQIRKLISSWKTSSSASSSFTSFNPGEADSFHISNMLSSTPKSARVDPQRVAAQSAAQNNAFLNDFQFPAQKMSCELMAQLNQGSRPTKAQRHEMIRIVSNDIFSVNKRPERAVLRAIAEKIVNSFPGSLKDEIDGIVCGSGFHSLFAQLEYRIDNLRRSFKSSTQTTSRKSSSEKLSSEPAVKKSKSCDSYGCVRWEAQMPVGEVLLELKEKQSQLQDIYKRGNGNNMASVHDSMLATYSLQRNSVNEGMDTRKLVEDWPFLFSSTGIEVHFSELVGKSLLDTMKQGYAARVAKILNFMDLQIKKDVRLVLTEMALAKQQMNSKLPEVVGVLKLLAVHFGETLESIFIVMDAATTVAEAEQSIPVTPAIIALGRSLMTAEKFFLTVGGVVVNSDITDSMLAVSLLFGTFFVTNHYYPADSAVTLEFLQRLFMQINPQRGTKAARTKENKQHAIHPKVLKLINALKDSEWNVECL